MLQGIFFSRFLRFLFLFFLQQLIDEFSVVKSLSGQ